LIRLNFVLPEWTRIIWTTTVAKTVWEPRINQVSQAFVQIEKQTTLAGIKPSWLTIMSPDSLFKLKSELDGTNFTPIVLQKVGRQSFYSSSSLVHQEHQPFDLRVVITKHNLVDVWKQAWKQRDNVRMGELLGFPKCCQSFFQQYWIKEKFIDTTYPMSLTGTDGPKECNILNRWLGVRAVSHLPCSFDCNETYQIGRQNINWARQNGYEKEMDWLEEILDWPIQWSALHGIAEIKTPILKISTRTDATGDLVVVNRQGFSYPDEGASGVSFPYINKATSIVSKNNSFKRGLLLENQWIDNGFKTFESMINSHKHLMECATILDPVVHYDIIDFGCGNGELLKNIQQRILKDSTLFGVELSTKNFNNIKYNITDQLEGKFYCDNMFNNAGDWMNRKYDLAIVMPGRLQESNELQRENFMKWISNNTKWVLFYFYGDWVTRSNQYIVTEPMQTLNKLGLQFIKTNSSGNQQVKAYIGKIQPAEKILNIL